MMNEKRFTDIWCSETGHIGVTDCGIDKEFTSSEFEDFLNELSDENKKLEEENDNMNLFIKQTIEPLLFDCASEMITIESTSQIELADKIEKKIIPFIQDFKYLKYESPEEEKQDKSE